jgi:hypothetical protein
MYGRLRYERRLGALDKLRENVFKGKQVLRVQEDYESKLDLDHASRIHPGAG